MTLKKSPFDLSDEELQSLARWPETFSTKPGTERARHGDALHYLRVLLDVLLRRQPRLMIESTIVVYAKDVHYFECLARLRLRDRSIEMVAGGSTPQAARLNAELFALRKAVFGQDVPILGRLLSRGRLMADLAFHGDRPVVGIQGGQYSLTLCEDHRDTPPASWLGPPVLPRSKYTIPVTLQPDDENRRTRYLLVGGLHPDIKKVVSPFMNTKGPIYLHRLLLALQGRSINNLKRLNELRCDLWLQPYEGELLHGHHINAIGYDNRQANLQALTEEEHASKHSVWIRSYNDISQGMEYRRADGIKAVLRPPPRIIVSPDHYDMVDMGLHLAEDAHLGPQVAGPKGDVHPVTLSDDVSLQTPVSTAEIKAVAGRSDRERNLRKVISALISLGGQGKYAEFKNARSLRGVSEGAVRNALCSLEGAGIIVTTRVNPMSSFKRGSEKHFRLSRPLAPDLVRLIRRRERTQPTRHTETMVEAGDASGASPV